MGETHFFTFPFYSRQVITALENFEYPFEYVQTSMFLLLCLLNVFQVLFKVKQLFKQPPRDLPQGWIVTGGMACGRIWAGI